jgi:DME family drug/metabolite transporter
MAPKVTRARDRLAVLGAALLFSTGGAAIKASSLGSWQVAGFRSGIAAVALWLLIPGARRGWTWRTALIGVAYAATLILFVQANKLTTSANTIFLQSTAPLYLLLLGPMVLKEAIRKVDLAMMAAVAGGVLLLLSGAEATMATAPNPHVGNAIAIGAGFAWALTITGLRWMGKHSAADAGAATVVVGNIIAFAFCLPMALPVTNGSGTDVAVLVYLGVFQVGLAYHLLTRSLRAVPGLEAATLLLAEPVFNPIWSWLVHGERPSFAALAGGVVIISAALLGAWWQDRRSVSSPKAITPGQESGYN